MNYRKILKNSFKILAYIIFTIVVIYSGIIIYFSKPWIIEKDEVRSTGNLETVRAYWGRACGEDFLSEENADIKLTIVVPEGGMTPDETNAVVPDNLFMITGYRYKKILRNILNGEIKEMPSQRFDTIEWHVVTPYKAYVDDPDELIKETSTPLGWKNEEAEPEFTFSYRAEQDEC